MLLRRMIEHLKTQNWTAVALDFVIVVFGVFIGIQVANWNDARATSEKSDMFSDRLLAELREEAWIHQYFVVYHEDVLENADLALRSLTGQLDQGTEQFLINAYRASQYTWWNRRRATFDELIATGGLGLIKDERLRSIALQVYASPLRGEIEDRGRQSAYREAFRMVVPPDVHRALGDQCGDKGVPLGDFELLSDVLMYECSLDLPSTDIEATANALRENAAIAPALRLRIATLETQLADLKENNEITAFFADLSKN